MTHSVKLRRSMEYLELRFQENDDREGDRYMMIFREKEHGNILNNEPYTTFIKKFDKLQGVINEKIHMRIDAGDDSKKTGFISGFCLDSCYAQWFELKFEFYGLDNEECNPNKELCVMHSLEYKFVDDDYNDMMLDMAADIEKRNGYIYLSSLVHECEVRCSLNNKNTVTVNYSVVCDEKDAKEVCLQLIDHNIALFTRSF